MAAKRRSTPAQAPADDDAQQASTPPATASAPRAKKPRGTAGRRTASAEPAAAARRRAVTRAEDLHAAAALIVAHDQARRIAATVRAARSIPGVDLVLVVDDASTDNTQELARKAGAVVVRHSHQRGRAACVETGASVIAMRDEPGRTPRAILLLPGSVGHHAVGAAPLVPAVIEHVADLAVAVTEGETTALGTAAKAARRAIEQRSGWTPQDPLGHIRCITREAIEAAMPIARGAGLEVGMTLDVLAAGLTVTEVACEVRHRPLGGKRPSAAQRAGRYRDVMVAVSARRAKAGASGARDAITRRGRRSDKAAASTPEAATAVTDAEMTEEDR
ncbi:glycosyltransferase [uncultured Demequina sp.]|uniref:glycosyltransferase family 2 protein n=1 Tax=uncultured Demequina sp. TaxID=693499 RepID=UPI0025E5F0DC|nr:glycosyltransferase [uncultured Demequina sp.]